ncbi:MAG: winged helix-turn-helix domain-containing protein [Bacillota bacterium]
MHEAWAAGALSAMTARERVDLAFWNGEAGGYLNADRLFRLEECGYDSDGFGQDPAAFLQDPATLRPAGNAGLSGKLSALAADRGKRERFLSFLEYVWQVYVKPLVEGHRGELALALARGREAVAREGAFAFLRGTSERFTLGGENDEDLLIEKRLDLTVEGDGLKAFIITPSLFAFPHLVVNYDAEARFFFEVTFDLPLRGGERWLSEVDRLAKVGFALSDKSRLRILMLIAKAPLTQQEICDRMGYAKSTISRHMGILIDAGLVQRTGEGIRGQTFHLRLPVIKELSPSLLGWFGID